MKLSELKVKYSMSPFTNNWNITHTKSMAVSSCIDVSFVSNHSTQKFSLCTDLETRGSDHYPFLLSYLGKGAPGLKITVKSHNWDTCEDSVDQMITAATTDDDLTPNSSLP